jgi:methylglutaconyl-CoA hydratase
MAFCAGMDLAYLGRLASFSEDENRADGRALLELLLAIRQSPLPWIAAVNGPAIAGGCGLATACDLILADRENARDSGIRKHASGSFPPSSARC